MKNKIIIIILFLLIPVISANSNDLEISFNIHYFKDGREVLPTTNTPFTDISFEIIGKNYNQKYRILNLSITDSYPIAFKKSLPTITIPMLRIQQQKTLFISQLIDVNNFNQTNISLWVGVSGIREATGEEIYTEGYYDLILDINKTEETPGFLLKLGDKVWQDNPTGGNLVVLAVIFVCGFFYWKGKGSDRLNKWRDKQEIEKANKRKFDEGW